MSIEQNKLDLTELKYRTYGCLWSVFIGDAGGLPVECKSPTQVRDLFGYITKYVTNKYHPYKNVAVQPAGTISDDGQLSLSIMCSLERKRSYDIDDIKKARIEAYQGMWGPPVGWGHSTKSSCENIINNITPTFVEGSAGNGPPIQITPLGIYSVYKTLRTPHKKFTNSFNHSLLKKCLEISRISHSDYACVVASYCQARMVIRAMQNETPKTTLGLAKLFIADAEFAENTLTLTYKAPWDTGLLSERLKQFCCQEMFDMDVRYVSTKICHDHSSFIQNSYPLTAYCVCKYLPFNNFQFAFSEIISAGSDADSNASMALSVIGASLSYYSIPTHLIKSIKKYPFLMKMIQSFEQSL